MPTEIDSLTLGLYATLTVGMVSSMLVSSYFLGQRHRERATEEPYEGGVWSTGGAWIRYVAQFYLVAVLFVLFDLEAAYFYAWSVAVRQLGWSGFAAASTFAGVLLVALLYLVRNGGLDWHFSETKHGGPP